jgi:Flp pilus assembly protein TadG
MTIFDRRRRAARAAGRERGQSLVEFAMSLPFILLIMAGLLDIGRAYFTFVALEDAAGEAAVYLAIHPECPYDALSGTTQLADNGVADDCDPPNNAVWRAREAGGGLIEWSNALVSYAEVPGTNVGEAVRVTITYPYQLLMPIIPEIAGSPTLTLTASASRIIITE